MSDALNLINGISTPVKIGWLVWLVWVVVQVLWYRHARVYALVLPPPSHVSDRTSSRSSVSVEKHHTSSTTRPASTRTSGSPEFLAALGLDDSSVEEVKTS